MHHGESRLVVAQRPTLHDVVTLYSSILSCTVNALGIRDTTCCNDASVVEAFAASSSSSCRVNVKRGAPHSRRRKHCTTFLSDVAPPPSNNILSMIASAEEYRHHRLMDFCHVSFWHHIMHQQSRQDSNATPSTQLPPTHRTFSNFLLSPSCIITP
jgi:hypothetical protein